MSVCQRCGTSLPPSRGPWPRKWCSERCRKSQYDRQCIDCGARVDGTTPSRCGGRCVACANRHSAPAMTATQRARWLPHRTLIESLWADGRTVTEIRVLAGIPGFVPGPYRARGYDLPHRRTPEQVARIRAGRWSPA